jgi:hypothetical protein
MIEWVYVIFLSTPGSGGMEAIPMATQAACIQALREQHKVSGFGKHIDDFCINSKTGKIIKKDD